MKFFYILTVSSNEYFDSDKLKVKLDLSIDWVKVMPNVFLLESTSEPDKWYDRLKPILSDNKFFLIEVDIKRKTGWLPQWVWDWLKNKKK